MVNAIADPRIPPANGFPDTNIHTLQPGETYDEIVTRYGLADPQTLDRFRALNPQLASGQAMPGQCVYIPIGHLAPASAPVPGPKRGASLETAWTKGYNRRIAGQNRYNAELELAKKEWSRLDPLVLKSMLAQESGFNPKVANHYGYTGIAQIGLKEARSLGLKTGASRMRSATRPAYVDRSADERLVPKRAIPAAADLMKRKAATLELGITRKGERLRGFSHYGQPQGDDYWRFVAAAYNGGEGTILLALHYAYGGQVPKQVRWDDLVAAPGGDISKSPLYRATSQIFRSMPRAKYREISEYARDVLSRARQ